MADKEVYFKTSNSKEYKVLLRGEYQNIRYLIVSYGRHPCCYIQIPIVHPLNGVYYDRIELDVHGGLTYSGNSLDVMKSEEGYWIGWDYAHAGDFSYVCEGKKWTVSELFEEVRNAIEQFHKLKPYAAQINWRVE